LDGSGAHAAACAEDEDVFTGLQFGAGEQHVPGGLEDQRDAGGFGEGEIFRIGNAIYFGDFDEFGATAVDEVAEIGEAAAAIVLAGNASGAFAAGDAGSENDFLAGADGGDVGADFGDLAGDVAAGDVRERDGDAGEAATDPEVEMIEGAGFYFDEDFVGADGGRRGRRDSGGRRARRVDRR
jgi:hypothetical protein